MAASLEAGPPSEERQRTSEAPETTRSSIDPDVETEARLSAEQCRILDLGAAAAGRPVGASSSSNSRPAITASSSASFLTPSECVPSAVPGRVRAQAEEFQRSTRSRSPAGHTNEAVSAISDGEALRDDEAWDNGEVEFTFQALPEGGAVREVLLIGGATEVHLKHLGKEEERSSESPTCRVGVDSECGVSVSARGGGVRAVSTTIS